MYIPSSATIVLAAFRQGERLTYQQVREALKLHGTEGCTFEELQKSTQLPNNELYQTILLGFKIGSIETWVNNKVSMYRNRPSRENLYGSNEWSILKLT